MDAGTVLRAAVAALAVLSAAPLSAQPRAGRTPVERAAAEVDALEVARIRGDSAAWRLVAPGFMFVHSTGNLDDVAELRVFRAAAATAGHPTPRRALAEPPLDRLVGDVFVRSRLLADPPQPGTRPGLSRVLDIYVRRGGRWLWLAQQSTDIEPRRELAPVERALLDDYAGSYVDADGRRRVFARSGDELVETWEEGPGPRPERPLYPLSDATFGIANSTATITFVRDRAGRVVAADVASVLGFVRFVRAARQAGANADTRR